MKRRAKVYLARPARRIILPILVLVWGVVTYIAFATPEGRREMDVWGWLAVSAILVAAGGMVVLASSGRFPMYEVEFEEEETGKNPR